MYVLWCHEAISKLYQQNSIHVAYGLLLFRKITKLHLQNTVSIIPDHIYHLISFRILLFQLVLINNVKSDFYVNIKFLRGKSYFHYGNSSLYNIINILLRFAKCFRSIKVSSWVWHNNITWNYLFFTLSPKTEFSKRLHCESVYNTWALQSVDEVLLDSCHYVKLLI